VLEEKWKMNAPLLIVNWQRKHGNAVRKPFYILFQVFGRTLGRRTAHLKAVQHRNTRERGSVWIPRAGFDVAITVLAPSNDACVSGAASTDISFTTHLMWDDPPRPGHGRKSHVSTQVSPWSFHASFPRLSNTDAPRLTFRKVRRKLHFVESEKSTRIANCTHVCKMESRLKSRLQHTGTLSDAAWPPRRLCYRPVVFFRHLRPVSPSFR
jgi:hypothetical protein